MKRIRVLCYRLRKNFYEVGLYLPYKISPLKYFYTFEEIGNNYYLYVFRLKSNSKNEAIGKIVSLYLN